MTDAVFAVWSDPGDLTAVDLEARLALEAAEYIVWLDAPARLLPGALEQVGAALTRFPSGMLYGDSRTGAQQVRRPAFSPLRLRARDELGDVRVFSADAVRRVGGFRPEADGSHARDLALRMSAANEAVLHLPNMLAARPAGATQSSATETDAIVVRDHLRAIGSTGVVTLDGDRLVVDYPPAGAPLVSIIIPTRGSHATIRGRDSVLVVDAVSGILGRSRYPALEFVIVADDATPPGVIEQLSALDGDVRVVPWSGPFNFSAKINRGAVNARGEYLLLLNDDIEMITDDWIEVMLGLTQQPGVGIVGPMLYFEDGSVQHGGHVYRDSSAGHAAFRWARGRDDALGSLQVDHEVSGVTAACAMVSASTFERVGGMSALFPGNYNDVDFCLKIRSLGLSAIWTPRAELFHFESKSRVPTIAASELQRLRDRWNSRIQVEAYSPDL